jgi:hypothetical protein
MTASGCTWCWPACPRLSAELYAEGFAVDHRVAPTLLAGLEAHRAEHRPLKVAATEPLSWGLRRMLQRHDVDLVRSNQFLCHPDDSPAGRPEPGGYGSRTSTGGSGGGSGT